MPNRVSILIEGYVDEDRATGTVTLVRTSEGEYGRWEGTVDGEGTIDGRVRYTSMITVG